MQSQPNDLPLYNRPNWDFNFVDPPAHIPPSGVQDRFLADVQDEFQDDLLAFEQLAERITARLDSIEARHRSEPIPPAMKIAHSFVQNLLTSLLVIEKRTEQAAELFSYFLLKEGLAEELPSSSSHSSELHPLYHTWSSLSASQGPATHSQASDLEFNDELFYDSYLERSTESSFRRDSYAESYLPPTPSDTSSVLFHMEYPEFDPNQHVEHNHRSLAGLKQHLATPSPNIGRQGALFDGAYSLGPGSHFLSPASPFASEPETRLSHGASGHGRSPDIRMDRSLSKSPEGHSSSEGSSGGKTTMQGSIAALPTRSSDPFQSATSATGPGEVRSYATAEPAMTYEPLPTYNSLGTQRHQQSTYALAVRPPAIALQPHLSQSTVQLNSGGQLSTSSALDAPSRYSPSLASSSHISHGSGRGRGGSPSTSSVHGSAYRQHYSRGGPRFGEFPAPHGRQPGSSGPTPTRQDPPNVWLNFYKKGGAVPELGIRDVPGGVSRLENPDVIADVFARVHVTRRQYRNKDLNGSSPIVKMVPDDPFLQRNALVLVAMDLFRLRDDLEGQSEFTYLHSMGHFPVTQGVDPAQPTAAVPFPHQQDVTNSNVAKHFASTGMTPNSAHTLGLEQWATFHYGSEDVRKHLRTLREARARRDSLAGNF